MLKEKLLEDLKDAMKTKNVNKKNAVQMVRTEVSCASHKGRSEEIASFFIFSPLLFSVFSKV